VDRWCGHDSYSSTPEPPPTAKLATTPLVGHPDRDVHRLLALELPRLRHRLTQRRRVRMPLGTLCDPLGRLARANWPVRVGHVPWTGAVNRLAPSDTSSSDWLTDRLKPQIDWYDAAARRSRIGYLAIRLIALLSAAAITIVSITAWAPPGWQPTWLPGILGAVIVLFESVQGLLRWRDQWLTYRATAESLKREQSLLLGPSGSLR
jgi:hypothetical protein